MQDYIGSSDIAKIIADFATELGTEGEKDISLMILGRSPRMDDFSRCCVESLRGRHIDCEITNIVSPITSMHDADFVGKKNVVLQIIRGETTYTMIMELLAKLNEYKIEPIGLVVVDGPKN